MIKEEAESLLKQMGDIWKAECLEKYGIEEDLSFLIDELQNHIDTFGIEHFEIAFKLAKKNLQVGE